MLATIRDNTRHVLNMQHITPNSPKRWGPRAHRGSTALEYYRVAMKPSYIMEPEQSYLT